jgi:hypothetical protein
MESLPERRPIFRGEHLHLRTSRSMSALNRELG